MDKYRNLHKWMIIPLVFMQAGIFGDYWGDFSDNAWSVHVHYWTGTLWYIYLILQPYYATHDKLATHRTNGIIGMFLAGGVCLTAFSMMHRDIATTERALEMPERFGAFEPWFFYGIAAIEIVMIISFGYAVIKSIVHRKELEEHAWWLISTVFIIMMPALGRGIQSLYILMNIEDWPNVDIVFPVYITQVVIVTMLLLAAWKLEKIRHPATYLALGVNLFNCLLEPLGKSEVVQSVLKAMIKG